MFWRKEISFCKSSESISWKHWNLSASEPMSFFREYLSRIESFKLPKSTLWAPATRRSLREGPSDLLNCMFTARSWADFYLDKRCCQLDCFLYLVLTFTRSLFQLIAILGVCLINNQYIVSFYPHLMWVGWIGMSRNYLDEHHLRFHPTIPIVLVSNRRTL